MKKNWKKILAFVMAALLIASPLLAAGTTVMAAEEEAEDADEEIADQDEEAEEEEEATITPRTMLTFLGGIALCVVLFVFIYFNEKSKNRG